MNVLLQGDRVYWPGNACVHDPIDSWRIRFGNLERPAGNPRRLLDSGFVFQYPDIDAALRSIV